jgi:hypothetical protein
MSYNWKHKGKLLTCLECCVICCGEERTVWVKVTACKRVFMYIYLFKGAKICCPIGYNKFEISAKLNSKTHLLNISFNFFVFCFCLASKLAKSANMSKVERCIYPSHFLSKTFFGAYFYNSIAFEISMKFCFWIPLLNF